MLSVSATQISHHCSLSKKVAVNKRSNPNLRPLFAIEESYLSATQISHPCSLSKKVVVKIINVTTQISHHRSLSKKVFVKIINITTKISHRRSLSKKVVVLKPKYPTALFTIEESCRSVSQSPAVVHFQREYPPVILSPG